ncbi:MAG: CotH kinase family protein [Saprospiraceae bacterium]|nr:CotH kinase family protein [Saprospiraceae bacterium]
MIKSVQIYTRNLTSILLVLCLSLLICNTGCKKEEEEEFIPSPAQNFDVPLIIPIGDEKYLNEDSDYIFDQEQLHTFNLRIPGNALNTLDQNPAAEEYVEGMLIFEGDTISPVGIRYKGSVGAWVGCLSGDNLFDPSGYKTCTKLSMKVKINWEGREEKFFKLKKLQFHSQNLDDSHLHERLGYWLFKQMDVPAPRSVHARLNINGEYIGLFALTEQIDNRFVKYNYKDDEGNLYKEIWPLNKNGNPYSVQSYLNALKTNEDENPSVELIRGFGQSIADAELEDRKAIVEQFMDINEIISYAVVDRTIRHDDGPFHWYCGGNDCSNHNYYWYEEPQNEKLHLIAWDLDNAFQNIITNNNGITPIADEWGETSNDCAPFQYLDARQWSATCDILTATWASYDELYAQMKNKLIDGPMSKATTDEMIDKWSDQIRDAIAEANMLHDDARSIQQWETAVDELKAQLAYAISN